MPALQRRLVERRHSATRRRRNSSLVATFALFDPVTLTFNLILIGGRDIVIDYPCAKFGDFSFSCFGFIVRIDR